MHTAKVRLHKKVAMGGKHYKNMPKKKKGGKKKGYQDMDYETGYEIISKTYTYGFCEPIVEGIIIGVSLVVSFKIIFNFIFRLRRCKCNDRRREEKM